MVSIEVKLITENTFWEGLDLIIRKFVDVWTKRDHRGCLIYVSYMSWFYDGPISWLFETLSLI